LSLSMAACHNDDEHSDSGDGDGGDIGGGTGDTTVITALNAHRIARSLLSELWIGEIVPAYCEAYVCSDEIVPTSANEPKSLSAQASAVVVTDETMDCGISGSYRNYTEWEEDGFGVALGDYTLNEFFDCQFTAGLISDGMTEYEVTAFAGDFGDPSDPEGFTQDYTSATESIFTDYVITYGSEFLSWTSEPGFSLSREINGRAIQTSVVVSDGVNFYNELDFFYEDGAVFNTSDGRSLTIFSISYTLINDTQALWDETSSLNGRFSHNDSGYDGVLGVMQLQEWKRNYDGGVLGFPDEGSMRILDESNGGFVDVVALGGNSLRLEADTSRDGQVDYISQVYDYDAFVYGSFMPEILANRARTELGTN